MSESAFLLPASDFPEALSAMLLSVSIFFDFCNFGAWLTEGLPMFKEPSMAFFPSNWLMRFPALDRSPSGFLPAALPFLCPGKSAFPETDPAPAPVYYELA